MKNLSVILIIVMVFSLVGCNNADGKKASVTEQNITEENKKGKETSELNNNSDETDNKDFSQYQYYIVGATAGNKKEPDSIIVDGFRPSVDLQKLTDYDVEFRYNADNTTDNLKEALKNVDNSNGCAYIAIGKKGEFQSICCIDFMEFTDNKDSIESLYNQDKWYIDNEYAELYQAGEFFCTDNDYGEGTLDCTELLNDILDKMGSPDFIDTYDEADDILNPSEQLKENGYSNILYDMYWVYNDYVMMISLYEEYDIRDEDYHTVMQNNFYFIPRKAFNEMYNNDEYYLHIHNAYKFPFTGEKFDLNTLFQ